MQASVIVLNLNGKSVLPRCLDHLRTQTLTDIEILIIDNASTDSSPAIARTYLSDPRFKLIQSPKNLGISGGRNLGAQHARGEIIAFIDNDGYAAPTWLEEAVRELTSAPDIGAVSSLVLFAQKQNIINGAGGTRNTQWYAGDLCFNEPLATAHLPSEVLYPMGCGMVIKREVMTRIGPLDEAALRWFDDVELGIRVWRAGYRVVVAPKARIEHEYHHSGKAAALPGWKRALQYEKLRLRTAIKYQPTNDLPRWLALELRELVKTIFIHPRHTAVLLMAYAWNLAKLSSAIKIRRS